MIRILIADDHAVVRRGLRAILEGQPGWEICGEAATGREAVDKTKLLKPNVVVMDISMPELNGLEATRQIRAAVPDCEVLVLTIHGSERLQRAVLAAGARGYLLKSDAEQDLVRAVEQLSKHKPFLTATVSELVLEGFLKGESNASAAPVAQARLTGREREIVQLLGEGKSNKEIAATLGISVKTVETHRANVMRKLKLRTLSDLIHYAIRNRIVDA